MKIAILSESPVDQAALAIFAEGLLGEKPEPINVNLQARSIPAIFSSLAGDFLALHYNSDAEALIVVVDCDEKALHREDHVSQKDQGDCRYCRIREIIDRTRNPLKPRPGQPELLVAIGLTVPSIEAWYLAGKNHEVGESRWQIGIDSRKPPFTKRDLKNRVYGTDRPPLSLAIPKAEAEARRIIANISMIETAFPIGFGLMANEIRSWSRRPKSDSATRSAPE